MKILLISGKAGSGKDSFAKELAKILKDKNKKVLITHYADLLKYICKNFLNWDGNKDKKGRSLLQKVGTDIFRKYNPEYWINFIKDITNIFPDEWDYIIIPDCRFKNEIESWKTDGYQAYHIRLDRYQYSSNLTKSQQNHESEKDLDDYDFDVKIFINEGYENVIQKAKMFSEVILDE